MIRKKILAAALIVLLTVYSNVGLVSFAFAQESTPEPTTEPTSTEAPTTEPVQSSDPTPVPTDPGTPPESTQPEATPLPTEAPPVTPTPVPTPTIPPYWSDEYDAWKAEQKRLEAERDAREDIWESNEENTAWVEQHGGSESYYVSGAWEQDQLAQQQLQQVPTPPQEVDPLAEYNQDPFAQTSTESCDPNAATLSGDGTSVANANCAVITNDSTAGGISGGNSAVGNDGPIDMTTGDGSAEGTLVNQANQNITDSDNVSVSTTDETFTNGSQEGFTSGEDSTSANQTTITETLAVDNSNGASVQNNMTVDGVSGANVVSGNDGDVTLSTGDLELIANMLNILNLNITGDDFLLLILNIFGTLTGDLDIDDIALKLGFTDEDELEAIAYLQGNADGSQMVVESTTQTDVNNSNTAQVSNNIDINGVSGANDVSGNDGGAEVVTGRITILANLMNFINANFTGDRWSFIMINIFGSLVGDIVLPDTAGYINGEGGVVAGSTTLADGTSYASATNENTTNVTNSNDVQLTNNVQTEGVTGNNTQNGNDDGDGAHTTTSGEVNLATTITNLLNFNLLGNKYVLLIINVFGKWYGQIFNFAGNGVMDAPGEGTFAALSVGGTTTGLTGTSQGENGSSTTVTNSETTNVNNSNTAIVENNINASGVSGGNNVSGNDSQTTLTTGWVEITANLLNIINFNVTGNDWLVVFLNVFGDFMGNMFFGPKPQQTQQTLAQGSAQTSSGTGGSSENGSSDNSSPASNIQESSSNSTGETKVLTNTSSGGNWGYNYYSGTETEQGKVLSYSGESTKDDGFIPQTEKPLGFMAKVVMFIGKYFDIMKNYFEGFLADLREFITPVFAQESY